jgi:hypothetical protein
MYQSRQPNRHNLVNQDQTKAPQALNLRNQVANKNAIKKPAQILTGGWFFILGS